MIIPKSTKDTTNPGNLKQKSEIRKTADIIPIAVEQALASERIDLRRMAEAAGNESYSQKLQNSKLGIDLSVYNDPDLRKTLAEFFYSLISDEHISYSYFEGRIYYGYRILIRALNPSEDITLTEFLEAANIAKRTGDRDYSDRVFTNRFSKFVQVKTGTYSTFDSDEWDLRLRNISPERISTSTTVNTLHFSGVKNQGNKTRVKQYIDYLLEITNLSLNTIRGKLYNIRDGLNLVDKPILDWTEADVQRMVDLLPGTTQQHKRDIFYAVKDFVAYLSAHSLMHNGNPFIFVNPNFGVARTYKSTSPDDCVIRELFARLNEIKRRYVTIAFLIIYCIGCRLSDVVSLKKNCLVKNQNGYYIRFYISKMRKTVENVIPPLLYDMIDAYRRTLPEGDRYIFPGKSKSKSGPMRATSLRRAMVKEIDSLGIKNSDGTPYHFTGHSFRHARAHRMLDANIPIQFIQTQLHHASAAMTWYYVEYSDKRKAAMMRDFVNREGKDVILNIPVVLSDPELQAEQARKAILQQMLPNGICARPVLLGKCPYGNKCLSCPSFCTSVEYLPVHKQHRDEIANYLQMARDQGWETHIQATERDLDTINAIIEKLERKEEGQRW